MIPEPAYSPSDVRRSRRMARQVIQHFLGSQPKRVVHKAGGLSNAVFDVEHDEGAFIVRIAPDPARLPLFLKEQWCVNRAREAGVPVAEILEVGQGVITSPYMIQRRERGIEATHHPERQSILRELGRLARVINSIKTDGFGETFDWSSNRLSFKSSFKAFLDSEFDWKSRIDVMHEHGLLTARQAGKLRSLVKDLLRDEQESTLAHGDLRLKNVLADPSGSIVAVLDWEHCCSAVAPIWDLAIALHDLSIDAKQAFVSGYGLNPDELDEVAPGIKALNVLHYAPHAARAAAAGDSVLLQTYKVRLSGALDLYSL